MLVECERKGIRALGQGQVRGFWAAEVRYRMVGSSRVRLNRDWGERSMGLRPMGYRTAGLVYARQGADLQCVADVLSDGWAQLV